MEAADVAVQALWASLVSTSAGAAYDLPQVQESLLGQAAQSMSGGGRTVLGPKPIYLTGTRPQSCGDRDGRCVPLRS